MVYSEICLDGDYELKNVRLQSFTILSQLNKILCRVGNFFSLNVSVIPLTQR